MHIDHDHAVSPANISDDDKAICPVMKVPVSKSEVTEDGLVREYSGKKYYLCCNTCVRQFDDDPEQYTEEQE